MSDDPADDQDQSESADAEVFENPEGPAPRTESVAAQRVQGRVVVDKSELQVPRNVKAKWWGKPIFQYKDHQSRIQRGDPDVHCTDCGKDLKYNGSSGNITGHMNTKHKGWEELSENAQITRYMQQTPVFKKAVVKWIVLTYQPLSCTEHPAFQDMIATISRTAKVPTRREICSLLDDLEVAARAGLRKELKGQFIAITSDAWTSAATEAFLSLTAHYIDEGFQMHTIPLECAAFPGSHTAENIKRKLEQLLGRNDIPMEYVSALVADNAANQKAAGDLLSCDSVPCAPHTLQLTVKDILEDPDTASLLRKARKVVAAFKHSALKGQVRAALATLAASCHRRTAL